MANAYINGRLTQEQSEAVAAVQKSAKDALDAWKDAVALRHNIVGLKVGPLDDGTRLYDNMLRIEELLTKFKIDIDKLKKEDDA